MYSSIISHFKTYCDDSYDFNGYIFRKGTLRSTCQVWVPLYSLYIGYEDDWYHLQAQVLHPCRVGYIELLGGLGEEVYIYIMNRILFCSPELKNVEPTRKPFVKKDVWVLVLLFLTCIAPQDRDGHGGGYRYQWIRSIVYHTSFSSIEDQRGQFTIRSHRRQQPLLL